MIKNIGKITLAGLLAAAVLGVPIHLSAADPATTNAPSTPAIPPKAKATLIRGTLGEIDKTAKTFTVEERSGKKTVYQVSSETKFFKREADTSTPPKASTLEEGSVGQLVTGSYTKSDDGKLVAKNVYWGGGPRAGAKKKTDTSTNAPSTTTSPK